MKTFKQFLIETMPRMPRMPLSRAEIENIKDQLRFAAQQATKATAKRAKEIDIPIHFSRADTMPKEFKFAFWMRRVGNKEDVGNPQKENPINPKEWIKVFVNPKVLLPDYAFILFQHLKNKGEFERIASGVTNRVSIKIADLKRMVKFT